ncbi:MULTISPECIES: hypothetical protein [Glutamicibacter]|uniref:hypothetical protein n=1 Tax=Glutamicibacter TaxID=1742989 RepID=UPI000EE33D56|nr:hypothetical protein [Glutamicibacter sp.]HCJ55445.1 hypothetical protein [Glutamicibacter sp.]
MRNKLLIGLAVAASVGLTACGGSSDSASSPAPAQSTDAQAQEGGGQKWADKQYDSFLLNYGVKSQEELLSQNSGSVQSYLVSAESPSTGTVVFTAQLTGDDVDQAEVDKAALAVLNLIGFSDDEVDRVEIVTADSKIRGAANRGDSPLLSK